MTQVKCKYCKKIMIEDYEEFVQSQGDSNFIECPYCRGLIWKRGIVD